MSKYNQDFFQIPSTGLDTVMTGGAQQGRDLDMKMSNFGDLAYGPRSSSDYTKVLSDFAGKIENPSIPSFTQEGEYNSNPLVWGSTVKFMRHDELRILSLGARSMAGDKLPAMDVSDTKLSATTPNDGTMPLNWPAEGWKPFGSRIAGPFGYRVSK